VAIRGGVGDRKGKKSEEKASTEKMGERWARRRWPGLGETSFVERLKKDIKNGPVARTGGEKICC